LHSQQFTERVEAVEQKDIVRVATRILTLDAYTEALVQP
jgi:predicted Zn-dependent peptidase